MIFSFFDPISYKGIETTDIFKNYRAYFNRVVVKYKPIVHWINGSPRPEMIAHELYGNQQLYWVILMLNNVYDPFYGWITSQDAAYEYASQQYPVNQVVYHVDNKGEKYWNLVEDPDFPGHWYDKGDKGKLHIQYVGALRAVDSLEAQVTENETRRRIMIISPADINAFLSDIIREMEKV
ncbi:baseplate wedge protein [Aeromonas phage B614]|nr:baseplate wedge protein [Aeromonas phage B614]UYD58242.1 baseplate wedge protein [Aeromonas phage UP87]UYD58356.1 baseplate wedge protein [Aeromonas phage avDM14-QBC]UYD58820.1 baseplate wedge protein [Aeromonas phage avDM10-HWA]UYD58877.1 baseplate wedge protein [Aeromonas phage avDM7-IJDJ]UYD59937.1 baseplate wedge protein [Aeromonas phage avDM9-HANS]